MKSRNDKQRVLKYMRKFAVIPARGGSKGLKDKNIVQLGGKPMMVWSIEAALKSGIFEKVIVSTDSVEYAGIAREAGADVMMRGDVLSSDSATTYDVLADLLMRVEGKYDYFTLLQPTSPFRNASHIVEAAGLFESRYDSFDFLVSLKEAEHAKLLVNPIAEDGSLRYFDTDFSTYRRQGYRDYSPNGAIFMAKPDKYLKRKHFFGAGSLAYVMDAESSVDIDTPLDYEFAKVLMKIICSR